MPRKSKVRVKSKDGRGFEVQLYLTTATRLLKDLTQLLEALGITAKFRISKIAASDVSTRSKGNRLPYASGMGEVLTHWYREPQYLDDAGIPKPLKMTGRSASFEALVKRALPGAAPNETLITLRRTGAVEVDKRGWIRPLRRTLPVFADHDLAIHHTFIALRGIVNTLKHNLVSQPTNVEQLFHRIAWSGDLRPKDVARLQVWINKHGQNFLESVDDWMKANSIPKSNSRRPKPGRACVGVYFDTGDE